MSGFPLRRFMAAALGVLGWEPDAFWRATPHELWAAFDGRAEVLGPGTPATRDDFEALKLRYPDR